MTVTRVASLEDALWSAAWSMSEDVAEYRTHMAWLAESVEFEAAMGDDVDTISVRPLHGTWSYRVWCSAGADLDPAWRHFVVQQEPPPLEADT